MPDHQSADDNINLEAQQRRTSILYISDLEIIKKSGDYLKSCGETLLFEETEINYLSNSEPAKLCKDEKNQDIYYQGDYLVINFYPPYTEETNKDILVVYLAEEGGILGYERVPVSSD